MGLMKTPELACEVTLQPVHDFGMDAAIIFADILTPLEGMGLELEFVEGKGPVLHNPVRNAEDVARLTPRPPEEMQGFTLDALKLVRAELAPLGIPLIGFAGAPFTLAGLCGRRRRESQPPAGQGLDAERSAGLGRSDVKACGCGRRQPVGAGGGRCTGPAAL